MMRPNAELAANDATTPLKQTNVGLLSPSQWQDVGNDAYGCIQNGDPKVALGYHGTDSKEISRQHFNS